jgi:hypothetical protein
MRFLRSSSVSLRNLPSGPKHDGGTGAAVSSSAFDSIILQTSASSSVRPAVPLLCPLTRIVPNLGVLLVASVFNQPFGKQYGKQGHASQSPTPGRRAVSQTMILTRHPATDRSRPPRAGRLLCTSFRLPSFRLRLARADSTTKSQPVPIARPEPPAAVVPGSGCPASPYRVRLVALPFLLVSLRIRARWLWDGHRAGSLLRMDGHETTVLALLARDGRIDRSVGGSPCARRSARPKLALRTLILNRDWRSDGTG